MSPIRRLVGNAITLVTSAELKMHRSYFLSTIQRSACRALLIAAVLLIADACDVTAPVDGSRSQLIRTVDPARTVSASSFTATAVSWSEVDIRWPTSPGVSGYQVFRSATSATGSYSLIGSTEPNVTSYADVGLTGSTQYCYEVRSFKNAGRSTNYSAFSSAVCATTAAPPVVAPSGTDAVPIGRDIRLMWKDNSTNEDGFHIEIAPATSGPWTQLATVGANLTTTSGFWATVEQQACFRVTAFNARGASSPSTPDCTTVPAPPYQLSAKSLDQHSITLSWSDNSATEDGYRVSRAQYGNSWSDIATLPPNASSYTDRSVTAEVSYGYRVVALKDGGYSDSAETAAVVTTTLPAAPSDAFVEFSGSREYGWVGFGLQWSEASSNVAGFRIEYSSDGVSGWGQYNVVGPNESSLSELGALFSVRASGCFRVIAFNAVGSSNPSNTTCGEAFGYPTDVLASGVDQQSIDLSWTDNASLETGYEVLRANDIGQYSVIADLPANATSYHDSGLAAGQEYWYYIVTLYNGVNVCCHDSDYFSGTTLSATASSATRVSTVRPNVTARATRMRPTRIRPHVRASPNLSSP